MQESPALAEGHRHRPHRGDVGEGRARHAEEVELDRHDDLALDAQVDVEGHRVDRDVDHALERVLDRHHAHVDRALRGGVEHLGHRGVRHELAGDEVGLGADGLLAERRLRAEEADAPRAT